MTVTLTLLMGIWFLVWGLVYLNVLNGTRPVNAFLGVLALLVGIVLLVGRFVVVP